MSNKKLSIIILFCDKDRQYLPNLLKQIRTNVKIPHEVVLIDNCTDPIEPDGDDFKYYAFGYNACQVAGRKKGVEIASGDYMWFVDVDDEVLPIAEDFVKYMEEDSDVVVFNVQLSKPFFSSVEKDFIIEGNLLQTAVYSTIGATLWNKWIRSRIVRKIERIVPRSARACALEDILLVIGALFYGKKLRFANRTVYRYRYERGFAGRADVESLEAYKIQTKGFLENRNFILKNFLKNNKTVLVDIVRNTGWFLTRLFRINSQELLEECIDVYLNEVIDNPDNLKEDFGLAYITYSEKDPIRWRWYVEALQKRFPNNPDLDPKKFKEQIPDPKKRTVTYRHYTGTATDKIIVDKAWSRLTMEKSLRRLTDITFKECI